MRTTGSLICWLRISNSTSIPVLLEAWYLAHGECLPLHIHSQLLLRVDMDLLDKFKQSPLFLASKPYQTHMPNLKGALPRITPSHCTWPRSTPACEQSSTRRQLY